MLEQTLFNDMNGLCLELMTELLSAGAATANDYEPEADERNAGNHGKKIVTLFEKTPEIKRTYYWNEATHKGHYPFDDKQGLVGRYTPAAANEMVRHARVQILSQQRRQDEIRQVPRQRVVYRLGRN